jgi:hypothetical protein
MSQPSTSHPASAASVQHSTRHASLAALGVQVHRLELLGPMRTRVPIAQKTGRYTPPDQLYAAFLALLAGAPGLVELNGCLRPDAALPAAFGRSGCADQAVVPATVAAGTQETVTPREVAVDALYRPQRQGYRHD